MANIHEIEKCMRCGARFKPFKVYNIIKEDIFKKGAPQSGMLSFTTPAIKLDKGSDIYRFLCAICCHDIVTLGFDIMIERHKKILSLNFDDLRKELKNNKCHLTQK